MPTVRSVRADGKPVIQRINGTTVPRRDDMFETPAADVGMASFSNFPAIEFAVVTRRTATDTAGTPPVARVFT
jgi:hypothetical protein